MNTDPSKLSERIGRGAVASVVLMALGGIGAVAGLLIDPRQLGYSYLLAFMVFLSVCLGGLFLVMMHHLFDAAWSVSVRRLTEHLACLSAGLAVLFIPLALLAPRVYPWLGPAHESPHSQNARRDNERVSPSTGNPMPPKSPATVYGSPSPGGEGRGEGGREHHLSSAVSVHGEPPHSQNARRDPEPSGKPARMPALLGQGASKAAWLNGPFFYTRAAVYFAVWIFLAWRLRYWSLKQDDTGAANCTYRMRTLSAGGIVLFAITLTLASIDWMKSLQPEWFSTMYGVYYFSGSVWVAVAVLYLLAAWLRRAGPLRELVQPRRLHDLGMLLLTFTIFSAYIHFSQYLIIWNGNLPEETFWYVLRERGYWWAAGLVLVFGHFLLPFLLLLRIDAKLKLTLMAPLCVWVCLMHFLDVSYNVLPPLHLDGFPWRWTDAACVAFVGGALGWLFFRSLARHPLYPLKDPRLKEALSVHEVPPPAIAEGAREREVAS